MQLFIVLNIFALSGTSGVEGVWSGVSPLLDQLPPSHRSTLDTLLEHLVKVASHEGFNKMSTHNLALLFGPTLLRPPPDDIQYVLVCVHAIFVYASFIVYDIFSHYSNLYACLYS